MHGPNAKCPVRFEMHAFLHDHKGTVLAVVLFDRFMLWFYTYMATN